MFASQLDKKEQLPKQNKNGSVEVFTQLAKSGFESKFNSELVWVHQMISDKDQKYTAEGR